MMPQSQKQVCGYAEQVDWKLKRGKWRPRLLDFAKAHSDATVQAASAAAFQQAAAGSAADASAALAPLIKLKVSILLLRRPTVSAACFLVDCSRTAGLQPVK